jgi:hypothetical protein
VDYSQVEWEVSCSQVIAAKSELTYAYGLIVSGRIPGFGEDDLA